MAWRATHTLREVIERGRGGEGKREKGKGKTAADGRAPGFFFGSNQTVPRVRDRSNFFFIHASIRRRSTALLPPSDFSIRTIPVLALPTRFVTLVALSTFALAETRSSRTYLFRLSVSPPRPTHSRNCTRDPPPDLRTGHDPTLARKISSPASSRRRDE